MAVSGPQDETAQPTAFLGNSCVLRVAGDGGGSNSAPRLCAIPVAEMAVHGNIAMKEVHHAHDPPDHRPRQTNGLPPKTSYPSMRRLCCWAGPSGPFATGKRRGTCAAGKRFGRRLMYRRQDIAD